jgi:D-alanyl-lipoteichoic acid acyltransferase DltB (MBOAT superfamily)
MVFNSYGFVLFFAVLLVLHNLPLSWKVKKINLLLASYLFYAVWNPPFVLLLWLATAVDFYIARLISREERPVPRKLLLAVSFGAEPGADFFFQVRRLSAGKLYRLAGFGGHCVSRGQARPHPPGGHLFYTFVTLSYTLDVYRRQAEPEKSFLNFALFVTFFPHLVAGPIVRPADLIPQFHEPRRATGQQFAWGMFLLSLGLFLKVVLADGLFAPAADTVFGVPFPVATPDAWAGVLAFSGQIFCDFAGYSTCAIGVALCLGFVLPENFRYPYAAIGFSDFWRRWHITLSTWLRDYLYIPLGGNRQGAGRAYLNLMITMLLGGLWHGASWTFVVWGALHGLFLCVERLLRRPSHREEVTPASVLAEPIIYRASVLPAPANQKLARVGLMLLTLLLVNITWVFFRAPDFGAAARILLAMFGMIPDGRPMLATVDLLKVGILTVLLVGTHWLMRDTSVRQVAARLPWWLLGLGWAAMLVLLILTQKSSSSFIYFQF